MNHLQKSYRPDPHAQYLLQLLALPTALVLIAAVRYVLKVVPAGIVNLICLLLLLAALLGIFILLPFWFRNTRYIITEQDYVLSFFLRANPGLLYKFVLYTIIAGKCQIIHWQSASFLIF